MTGTLMMGPTISARQAFDSGEMLFEKKESIAILTFNRPEVRNALTFGMYEALYEVCQEVERDQSIRVLILRGAGENAFVAGTDISQFRDFEQVDSAYEYEYLVDRSIGSLDRLKKPVIAALHGFTVGGGAAIACAADLRIATPDLRFGLPIARTLGNCINMRMYSIVLDLLGPARTKEVLFTARLLNAEELLSAGLINEIVPCEQLDARVEEMARSIAGNAPLTIQVSKEAICRLMDHRRIYRADDLLERIYRSRDFREGVDAFLEKRRPFWQGR